MADQTINELSGEIKEQLPEHAQQIFLAALNAAQSNGLSEDKMLGFVPQPNLHIFIFSA